MAPLGNEVGAEDVLIGLTAYFADNGTAVFGGMNELIPGGGTLELLVAYEVAGPSGSSIGETLIATVPVGGVSLEPDGGGTALTPTGLPLTGPTLTIGGQLVLSLGASSPSGTIQNPQVASPSIACAIPSMIAKQIAVAIVPYANAKSVHTFGCGPTRP